MGEVDIPTYFICPISLQIMKDPVTVATGITYDRESIEQWFLTTKDMTCPVTKQPLPKDNSNESMTPNHTLRRLIQQWCTVNAINGVDRIPTPKFPLNKIYAVKLVKDLGVHHLRQAALKKMEELAAENERNRRSMAEAGVAKALILFIVTCFREGKTTGLLEALRVLHHVWSVDEETEVAVIGNNDLLESLMWVLGFDHETGHSHMLLLKIEAILVLKMTISVINTAQLEQLKPEFFMNITKVLLEKKISRQAVKSALHVLVEACPWGRNKMKIVETGAVFQLIELELLKPEKHITELIFNLLANLCCCADGRAQFLKHGGSMAMVSKRILRVSPATDDLALQILSSISKFSATHGVVLEMLLVGAVSKLCMVMQADCPAYLKQKVSRILRLHSNVWNNSPCIAVYLLTRPR
ncbi:E3 ubiquitin-protein ligase PUB24-like [Argentina anserina]|uniref:E3 ubiquitin-protein ligase PUB24-like n=1 Tax=Argentina anserina TaxID=57926 RepID=UPI0021765460|nr:E3 ubiquitin-protein ligase PUB24-like [Potentilla anserina]